MVAGDPGDLLLLEHVADDARAQQGVLAHDRELLLVERPVLEQDRVGDADLADVVQQRGVAQQRDAVGRPAAGDRQAGAERRDALGVLLGGGVLGVDGPRQRAQADERLGAIELAGALALVELAHDRRVVEPAQVAPVLLGPVQGGVGAPQRLVARARGLEVAEPDRHRGAQPVAQRRLGDRAPRAVGAHQRLVAVALDEDHAVLVGAHAGEHVLLAHRAAQQGADLHQHLVGHVEAGAVVEVAEAVDVDEGDGQGAVVALGARDLLGQPLAEGAVVGQAGERVRRRLGVERARSSALATAVAMRSA